MVTFYVLNKMEGICKMSLSDVRIMIFSWNHQAVRIGCSKYSSNEWSWLKIHDSHPPDFFDGIEEMIVEKNPDIVVFGSQEDAIPGSYFHSNFLPKKMGDLYYNLQKRTRLMGLGIETYKALKTLDFKLRGLRLSLYSKPHLTGIIDLEEREMRDFMGERGQSWANCSLPFFQSKGAVASYLKIPGIEPIAFICAHLPFDAESLKEAYFRRNSKIREQAVQRCNESFNYLLKELVYGVKLENFKYIKLGHVFFFGDLNYRVFCLNESILNDFTKDDHSKLRKIYENHDELRQELSNKTILVPFEEGVEDTGPLFLPTCKMRKPRKNIDDVHNIKEIYNIGRGQRLPSWSDRILYYDRSKSDHKTHCLYYNRYESGETMKRSDHAAIVGIFDIK